MFIQIRMNEWEKEHSNSDWTTFAEWDPEVGELKYVEKNTNVHT